MKKLNWACIGCGDIAGDMAKVMDERGNAFYCVYSRTYERAAAFAEKYSINKVCSSADEVFGDEKVDIVYIATPHNHHLEYIIKAAQSKKHILCEKAITLSSSELEKAIAVCEENGVILAEAQTIFHMPVYNKVFEYIKDGSLGKLRLIDVEFGTRKEYDETNRFYSPDLAGGTMLDIGVYALSFVRCFLSETASEIKSSAQLAPTGVDEQGIILLSNSRGEMASVLLSFVAKLPRVAVASFENGFVEFDNFNRSCKATITLFDARQPIVITSDTSVSPLLYEARDMEEAVLGGENKMRLNLTRDVMDIMTKLRYDWGVRYPEEIEN
ncbi:MAG: Gfo/Idh/MocA family oxidoreductase [Eubacterium sp.]|nr:Gfo/Idh/MocA family oxidoreductase [Eubacterium sp.]